jgi:energy-coupling factor transport system substrate-specific component
MSVGTFVALSGVLLLLIGFAVYERRDDGPRELGLIAVLIAAAIVTGAALGPRSGAAVGAGAALVSNTFLGQGPWTPWQMLLWGAAGASAGLVGPLLRRSRTALIGFGVLWGLVFGAGMDVYQLAVFGPAFDLGAFIALHARAIPFDLTHALANAAILGLAGPVLIRLIGRSANRVRGRWVVEATDP